MHLDLGRVVLPALVAAIDSFDIMVEFAHLLRVLSAGEASYFHRTHRYVPSCVDRLVVLNGL